MCSKKIQNRQRSRYDGASRLWERQQKERRKEQGDQSPFSATALNADSKGKDTSKSFGEPQCGKTPYIKLFPICKEVCR